MNASRRLCTCTHASQLSARGDIDALLAANGCNHCTLPCCPAQSPARFRRILQMERMHNNRNTTPTTQHVKRVVRRVGQSCLCCVPIHTNSPRFFLIFQPSLCSKSSISSRTSVRCARRLRSSPSTIVLRMFRACCTSEILCHREAEVREGKHRARHLGAHPHMVHNVSSARLHSFQARERDGASRHRETGSDGPLLYGHTPDGTARCHRSYVAACRHEFTVSPRVSQSLVT